VASWLLPGDVLCPTNRSLPSACTMKSPAMSELGVTDVLTMPAGTP
jgi:hypothetical protein